VWPVCVLQWNYYNQCKCKTSFLYYVYDKIMYRCTSLNGINHFSGPQYPHSGLRCWYPVFHAFTFLQFPSGTQGPFRPLPTQGNTTYKHKRQTSMPRAEFEPAIPATKRPQIYASDRAATGIGNILFLLTSKSDLPKKQIQFSKVQHICLYKQVWFGWPHYK
jgi:hypothetical protein